MLKYEINGTIEGAGLFVLDIDGKISEDESLKYEKYEDILKLKKSNTDKYNTVTVYKWLDDNIIDVIFVK